MRDSKRFSSRQAQCFTFSGYDFEPASGVATLSYRVDGLELDEKITFPFTQWPADASRQAAFMQALEILHLVAGISYYKAGLAVHIDTCENRIDTLVAAFLNDLYLSGLGEFAHINQLDLSGLIDFEVNNAATRPEVGASADDAQSGAALGMTARALDLPQRALVAMGGGKDSLVCLQMLRDAGIEVQPACVGGSKLIGETAKAAGLPLLRIQRQLAPELTELNTRGAWNGHVPVTAINSAILVCAGLLYGYRYIVFANESSANEATLKNAQGQEVNHQYSKSFAFERAFRLVLSERVSPDIEYFSLLRPFSEVAICRLFSNMQEFHQVFSSCNRNFHLDGSHIEGRWCQDCPKCRFAALALAPFLPPEQLVAIQGADLLDDERQLQGFKELCGLGEQKPFECVGSVAECRAAMKRLAGMAQWQNKKNVRALAGYEQIEQAGALELDPNFGSPHCIPDAIMTKLNAL
jgi:hypothetical protein